MRRALTIAGSDSSGGAGIQADLITFSDFSVHGMSVITAITCQNTKTITEIEKIPPKIVEKQIDTIMNDMDVNAFKTGMLFDTEIIEVVSKKLRKYKAKNLVVDTVFSSGSGIPLIEEYAIGNFIKKIIPLAFVLTPNILEAERMVGKKIISIEDKKRAAVLLKKMGAKNVLIKGGHDSGEFSRDLFFDGKRFEEFSSRRISIKNFHGSGCTFSAAITACLARGMSVRQSIINAKKYVTCGIRNSYRIGHGGRIVAHIS